MDEQPPKGKPRGRNGGRRPLVSTPNGEKARTYTIYCTPSEYEELKRLLQAWRDAAKVTAEQLMV